MQETLLYSVQTSSRPNPASYPVDTGGLFPSIKKPDREANHSPAFSAEVRSSWKYTYTSPLRLHGVVLYKSTGTTLIVR